jgi:DNA-binding response OmpR family regulator
MQVDVDRGEVVFMAKKIVIIDDEQDVLEILKATLKTKGYHIITADNGEDGWRLILQQRPDLIITDLKMPKMSGLELRKKLQAQEELKNTPIIILSGIGKETGKPDEFWRSGLKSDDFISKPFDPLDLLGRVEYIFRRSEYISSGGTAQRVQVQKAHTPPPESQTEKSPERVVKDFIEAWNTQDFHLEFLSQSEEMTGGIAEEDYTTRRMQCYHDAHGQHHTQNVVKVEESTINRNLGKVVVMRQDTQGARVTAMQQTYALKKTMNGWKIVSVRSKQL